MIEVNHNTRQIVHESKGEASYISCLVGCCDTNAQTHRWLSLLSHTHMLVLDFAQRSSMLDCTKACEHMTRSEGDTILDTLDRNSPLILQPLPIPLLLLLLAVLKSTTSMTLQHPVFPTEMPLTESTITHDPLRRLLAVFELTFDLLWRTASDRQSEMECAFARYAVVCECA